MSQIYLSCNNNDIEFVNQVVYQLKKQGHKITIATEITTPDQSFTNTLINGLKYSDVFVSFLSKNSINSNFVISEISVAKGYAQESDRLLVIPVFIDNLTTPLITQDIPYIIIDNRDASEVASKIGIEIARFSGKLVAKEEKAVALSRKIEINAAEYIEEAIKMLDKMESRNRIIGIAWYISGFLSLILGIIFAITGAVNLINAEERGWIDFSIIALKSIIAVGLLGACSKYAFTLGKSYVSESLKSADRMHAISFGKFYLRVYGDTATWPEVKEVFQHWNIDRTSSFSGTTTAEFDPKLLESLMEFARIIANKGNDKK